MENRKSLWWHDFRLRMGKYKGMSLKDVAAIDPDYVRWAVSSQQMAHHVRARFQAAVRELDRERR